MGNNLFRLTIALLLLVSTNLFAENAEWAYADGAMSPEKWGSLSPSYKLCDNGKNQSPINIDSKKNLDIQTRGIKFNYGLISPKSIKNNGKLIQVFIDASNDQAANIKVDGLQFKLTRLDIHIPSEHTVDNKHYPMEIQFIHKSANNELAIVSRMVVPGRPDRTLRRFVEFLPMKAGESKPLPENALRNIELKKKFANYYRYSGSLTSPPCTEGVHWFIMKQPLTISKKQYEQFKIAIKQDNNRPLQDLNARIILE